MLGTFQVGEVPLTQKKARQQREKQKEESKKQPEIVSIVIKYQ
jgi:hypothetical protein